LDLYVADDAEFIVRPAVDHPQEHHVTHQPPERARRQCVAGRKPPLAAKRLPKLDDATHGFAFDFVDGENAATRELWHRHFFNDAEGRQGELACQCCHVCDSRL